MPKRRHTDARPVAIRFDPEDEKLLEACSNFEKLTISDTMRRAVRHYAKHLGVEAQQEKVA